MGWQAECARLAAENRQLKAENAELRSRLDLPPAVAAPSELPVATTAVHSQSASAEKINLFRSLFRGREDVFARRWYSEKTEKGGYAPVCGNEWQEGLCDKRRYKCAQCPNRKLLALTDEVLFHHLAGENALCRDVVGLYPMLADETCCFLAIDFDDGDWRESAAAVRDVCIEHGIPSALERSRSGEGAHLWIFFANPVPCATARRLGSGLLTAAMEGCHTLKFASYDRMFPSQDTLPTGGFGNLIALPLQGRARKNGNSVFVDESFVPYPDQFAFLSTLVPMSAAELDEKITTLCAGDELGVLAEAEGEEGTNKPWAKKRSRKLTAMDFGPALTIVRANMLYLPTESLSDRARDRVKRLAAFRNPDFYKAQAMRLPTYNKPRIISAAEESDGYLAIPRGCEAALRALLDEAGAAYTVQDKTNPGSPLRVEFTGELREEQGPAARALFAENLGVLSATTAFGKTVIAAWLIAQRKTNTLILVHTQALLNQWKSALQQFLTIDEALPEQPKGRGRKKELSLIGQLGGAKDNLSGFVDIAIFQSLVSGDEVKSFVRNYGMVIVDECHHVSAVSFEKVLREVNARYVYGLTATPTRQDGHQPIIQMQCGPIRYRVDAKEQAEKRAFAHSVLPRFTTFAQPMTTEGKWTITQAYAALCDCAPRNEQIVRDVTEAMARGRSPIVLTERYGHAQALRDLLAKHCDRVVLLSGKGTAKEKRELLEDLRAIPSDAPLAIVATGKYVGEGFDFPRLDTLFLAMPIAWQGTLAQYAGRLHRSCEGKDEVMIYDYVDLRVPMLERMYHKRLSGYAALGYTVKGAPEDPAESASLILDRSNYLEPFARDVGLAKKEVIIVGPYVHKGKAAQLLELLDTPISRGAGVKIITGDGLTAEPETRKKLGAALNLFRYANIPVDCRSEVYQRFAVIDQSIVWYGSVNLLAYDYADEGIMRFQSPELAAALLDTLR